ncbi:hypothetical protein, partial [Aeromonas veronii]|uniref:hypothetical protein n=1 Tax=Aeromonas veronii TaxID=654 RepID=UPI003D1AE8D7
VLNIVPRLPLKLRGAKCLDLQGANLESLPEMPREALQAASDDLISGLKKMMPEAQIVFTYVEDKE